MYEQESQDDHGQWRDELSLMFNPMASSTPARAPRHAASVEDEDEDRDLFDDPSVMLNPLLMRQVLDDESDDFVPPPDSPASVVSSADSNIGDETFLLNRPIPGILPCNRTGWY